MKMNAVKITVIKKEFYSELAQDVDTDVEGEFGVCPSFEIGETFIVHDMGDIPNGFCAWAWADIQRDIAILYFGGQPQPTMKNRYSMYCCCDEGIRPVIFKLERMERNDKNVSEL